MGVERVLIVIVQSLLVGEGLVGNQLPCFVASCAIPCGSVLVMLILC